MKKNIVHIIIAEMGVIGVIFWSRSQESIVDNIIFMILGSLFFIITENILCIKRNREKCDDEIIPSGVLGARGLCMLFNVFVLTYILETFNNMKLNIALITIGLVGIIYCNKEILDFWLLNEWNKKFCVVFFSINFILTGIYGIICFFNPNSLIIDFEKKILLVAKLALGLLYIIFCRGLLVEDNWFMKKISLNDKMYDEN